MQKIIENINRRLEAASEAKIIPPGLAYGKMGLCIYLYRLARAENNERYGKTAGRLLDEIFEEIGTVKTIDLENGLSGIGLGISYLVRNGYVEGDENGILREIDDEIFKQISFPAPVSENVGMLIQIMLYAGVRKQTLRGEQGYLWDELAIHIVNDLHARVEKILNDDVTAFNINSLLSLFLFALGKIYETGIYNHKVKRIVSEITPFVMSKFSCLDSRKLYLAWGIGKITKHTGDRRLAEYGTLLASQIDVCGLLDEFRSENMYVHKGLAGVCLLMLTLDDDLQERIDTGRFYAGAIGKIKSSTIWKLAEERDYLLRHAGIFGYCGVATIFNFMIKRT